MAGFSQAQLDALEAAIAQGVKTVRYGDKHVEYQSTQEMLRLRDLMKRELGQSAKDQRHFPTFSKGF
jgi:hypothetical protein